MMGELHELDGADAYQFSQGITFLLFFVYPQGEMPALYILTMFIMGRPKPNRLP